MSKPPRKNGALTAKQAAFVSEYMIDKNATQAAIRAGYSAKSAEWLGYQLLQLPLVSAAIQQGLEAQQKRTLVTADYIINGLKTVADRSLQAEPVLDNQGNPTGEYRFDSSGANKAFDLLGRHISLWNENRPIADAMNTATAAAVAIAERDARDKKALARIMAKTKAMK